MKYYYYKGGTQIGPVDIETLRDNITAETPVWGEGMENWCKAKEITALKNMFAISPPPFQPVKPPVFQALPSGPKKKNYTVLFVSMGIVITGLIVFLIINNQQVNAVNAELQQQNQMELMRKAEEENQRAAIEQKKTAVRANWKKNFRYSGSPYRVGILGGISDLKITFVNNSPYRLDEFSVAVNYILASGNLHATDIVSVYNLEPGETKTVDAPGASRGTSVSVEYDKIVGTQFNFLFQKDYFSGRNDDPYYKK